jgi:hypothetical protein
MICGKCKKEVAIQDAYREAAKEYYCSTCWKARPLQHMPPGKYEHGCEFSNGDHETFYCCYQIKGESLKLKTMPEDGYYTDIIEVKFCPFCGYTIPFKRLFKCSDCGIEAPDKNFTLKDYDKPLPWIIYYEKEYCEECAKKNGLLRI